MKNLFTLFCFLLAASTLSAQLVNNGATITIESGAKLIVESDVSNTNSGIINIASTGELEVQGDLTNSATINASTGSIVRFSGTANSDVTSGGAQLSNVKISKNGATETVTLLDAMEVDGDMDFTENDNKVIIGTNDLTFTVNGTTTLTGTNSYIQADGSGMVVKDVDANGAFKFEIGDATDYTPVDVDYMGTVYTSANISANTVSAAHPSKPALASDYLERYWNVDQTGITAYSAMLTGTYATADIAVGSTETDITGATYDGAWSYDGTMGDDVNNTVSADVDGAMEDLSGTNSFGIVTAKAFLDGPFSGGSMSTLLNSTGLLEANALTSPYGDGATVTAGFFTANPTIVDWVFLETRNSTTPATVEGGSSAFIKSDGSIVGLDGTSNPLIKNAMPNGYLVIKHRNHLAVSSNASLALDGSAGLQDFSSNLYVTFGSNARNNNGGTMTMWAGDTKGDANTKYQGTDNDRDEVKNDILAQPGNIFNLLSYTYNDYSILDANLDGVIKFQGSDNDNDLIKNLILAHPSNIFNLLSYTIAQQTP